MSTVNKMRFGYLLGFFFIAFLLGMAEFLQVYKGMIPCPLCLLQRMVLMLLGIIFFIGMLFPMRKSGFFVVGLLSLITCISGILLAGRQVWLQHIPPTDLGECGVSLYYMFQTLPVIDIIKHLWTGGVECSQQGWSFMSLSLAEWSLIGFVGFFVFSVVMLKRSLNV